MPDLPTGTVTFLFTDIEGSTRLWEQHPEAMQHALARHDTLLRAAIEAERGHVFKTVGDQFCAAFAAAPEALAASLAAQQALLAEPWEQTEPLRVRMALYAGAAQERDGDYFGPALNRVARLLVVGHGGQILLAAAAAEGARAALPTAATLRDLGSHRLKDLQQPEHLFQLLHPDLPGDFPPLRSLEAFAHNLPAQLTSFIGREEAMAAVKQFLAATRLLTLTGSGGCGKTRLALQVAAELLEEYADGVWLVELAALADPALVPQTVAATLGLREEPGRPLTATLTHYLRPKSLLLILDNCEHLLTACAQLADGLLRSCPHLGVLASSREGLGIGGEQTYRVPSLSLPDGRRLPPLERLRDVEAVQLFVDRARLSQAAFALTPANAPAVAQVCQRLDGIPLAIELAAARVKALPVEQLNERLDDMFRLLTGGSRTALPRQQTLRALIDWSYDLLSEGEQTLLRRLSVFAGGWTLGAAEAVCAGEVVDALEVLDLLTSLVDKSLVAYDEQGGEGRYRLLETVRQYARDRLVESGEGELVRGRHRDRFLALAEQAEPELEGAHQQEWLERLEREHGNLRAALAWSGAEGQGEVGLRLGSALVRFWDARGYWSEGREHLAGLLALPAGAARTMARAGALRGAGALAIFQGDWGAARALYEESLAISRELGDKRGIADTLSYLGRVAGYLDDEAARALLEESLAIHRELGDKRGIATVLHNLSEWSLDQRDYGAARALAEESLAFFRELGDKRRIAWSLEKLGWVGREQGDYGAARALAEESLALFRELGDKKGIAFSLRDLGRADHAQGDYEAARALYEESLALFRELGNKPGIDQTLHDLGNLARKQADLGGARALLEASLAISRELGDKRGIAWSLTGLGWVAHGQGDNEAARALFGESLAIGREAGNKPRIVEDLEGLAAVAVAQGQPERAARLFGAAEGRREAMGAPLPPADRAEHGRSVAAARTAMGDAAFAAAWAEGRAMALPHAVEYALKPEGTAADE